jgi:hypothetical protein
MLICWDLAFPEAFRELIANGAKIIITPTFWTLNDCNPAGLALNPSSEALFLDSMLTSRAFENTCGMSEALFFLKGVLLFRDTFMVQRCTKRLTDVRSGHLR